MTEVGKKLDQTRNNSSFGWNLTSTSFSLNANNSQNIFYADRNGIKIRGNAEVTGKICVIGSGLKGWRLDRVGKVELAILRLAVYEICFDDDVPAGAAINEAVELAKKFGQDNAGQFVNGVLAQFAAEK